MLPVILPQVRRCVGEIGPRETENESMCKSNEPLGILCWPSLPVLSFCSEVTAVRRSDARRH